MDILGEFPLQVISHSLIKINNLVFKVSTQNNLQKC